MRSTSAVGGGSTLLPFHLREGDEDCDGDDGGDGGDGDDGGDGGDGDDIDDDDINQPQQCSVVTS